MARVAADRRPVPELQQLLPDSFDHEITIPRDELMGTARRVSLLAQKNVPIRMSFGQARLTMQALTQDVGQAEESLDIEFAGEPFEIGFNPAFLIDGIDAIDARACSSGSPPRCGRSHQWRRGRLRVSHHADSSQQLAAAWRSTAAGTPWMTSPSLVRCRSARS